MKTHSELMLVRSIRVDKHQIGYLRWCLESHDGIATPTTRMDTPDIIDLSIAPDYIDEAEALINALEVEIGVKRVEAPLESPLS